jgi:hypothetical protein
MGDTFWMIVTSCILCAWVATAGICLERAIKRSTALVRARLRIEDLEADLEEVLSYVRDDAYCPCCGDNGPEHGDGCEHRDERMDKARAVLADFGEVGS